MSTLQAGGWPVETRPASDNPRRRPLRRGLLAVRRSRAIASMLPALLLTGIGSLVASGVCCLLWPTITPASYGDWMEAWLVSWPIAFPFAYLLGRPLVRLALRRLNQTRL